MKQMKNKGLTKIIIFFKEEFNMMLFSVLIYVNIEPERVYRNINSAMRWYR